MGPWELHTERALRGAVSAIGQSGYDEGADERDNTPLRKQRRPETMMKPLRVALILLSSLKVFVYNGAVICTGTTPEGWEAPTDPRDCRQIDLDNRPRLGLDL